MTPQGKKPNIVLVVADHYRGDVLGHVGNPAAVTPNLDAVVAADGVSFRNAFCQAAVCTPSRCSFMSGWYPHVGGHRTMHHMLHEHEPMLLRTLKQNGYNVWWGGKNDLVPAQRNEPWEPYCNVRHTGRGAKRWKAMRDRDVDFRGSPESDTYYSFFVGKLDTEGEPFYHDTDWDCTLGAVEFIRSRPAEPFCLYLCIEFPDPPYAVEEPWFSTIDREKVPPRKVPESALLGKPSILRRMAERYNLGGWSEDRWRELRATAYGMCARVDHHVGMVAEALCDTGTYDDTAVFFFSDHADYLGDYDVVDINQNTFEDSLIHVPLVVKPPASTRVKPRVCDALVELVDVQATVLELAGIEPEYSHFGRSLLSALAGETDDHRDAVFAEGGRLHGERHCMGLESEKSHHKDSIYWPRVGLQTSEGPEHTKAVMCRTQEYKYIRRLYESDEFYNLRSDPNELCNRIDDPDCRDAIAMMKDRMLTFFLETSDVVPHDTDKR